MFSRENSFFSSIFPMSKMKISFQSFGDFSCDNWNSFVDFLKALGARCVWSIIHNLMRFHRTIKFISLSIFWFKKIKNWEWVCIVSCDNKIQAGYSLFGYRWKRMKANKSAGGANTCNSCWQIILLECPGFFKERRRERKWANFNQDVLKEWIFYFIYK